jgi:transcriptional regulator with PAS, ATPase and Fis domain
MIKLVEILDVVQKFAEASRAALKLDVEIIDEERRFIAGTGRVKQIFGNKVKSDGVISRYIFEKGEKQLIVNTPGEDEICRGCDRYGNCDYLKAIYTTINYNGKVIGVIGVAASTKDQEKLIINNEKAMVNFLDKISNLISTKVHEREMLKQVERYTKMMETVYDNIHRGALIVDKNYQIVRANKYILNKLNFENHEIERKNLKEIFPGINLDSKVGNVKKAEYEEYEYKKNGATTELLYCSTPIIINNELELILYFFEDYKAAKRFAFSITGQKDSITFDDIIGENDVIVSFKNKVKKVSKSEATVLLIGETGTGKELFARSIHNESHRKNKPFIAINCGAIPDTLIESELFGYEKGSFTGAEKTGKHGKFYLADKGTVFLDEVENMPIYLQQKLLRVIERKEVERIGSIEPIEIDVRFIAATNVDLKEMVERGEFREDLYHRLNVIPLKIPPLRDRGEDILLISKFFINKFASKLEKNIKGLDEEVVDLFKRHNWKGNVRELQNTIEYAVNMENNEYITVDNLPVGFKVEEENQYMDNIKKLDYLEKNEIKKALNLYGWDDEGIKKASKDLGISRSTVYRRISKYNLKEESMSK